MDNEVLIEYIQENLIKCGYSVLNLIQQLISQSIEEQVE